MSVLVVAPTGREAAACGPGTLVCGGGAEAGKFVDFYLERSRSDLLIVAGVCGGLDPSLSAGSLILGRSVIASDEPERTPNHALFEAVRHEFRARRVPFVSSALLTLQRPADSRRRKTELWNTYGAAGADMESYAITKAAEAHGADWLVLRAVLDPAGSGLPADVRDWQGDADEARIRRRIARHPFEWPAYGRLALELRKALAALRQAVPLVVAAVSSVPAGSGAASSDSRLAVLE